MGADSPELDALTATIIGGAFAVGHALGHGFLEAVYKNALAIELTRRGVTVAREKPFPVRYLGQQVGVYVADLVVNDTVILERRRPSAAIGVRLR